MTEKKKYDTGRRRFIKAAAGGAIVASSAVGKKVIASPSRAKETLKKVDSNQAAASARAEFTPPETLEKLAVPHCGSDFMVDVIKKLGIEYIAACPGDSFRGLQESLIHYGGNRQPEWLTCTHESVSVGVAIGYARASSGKPMAVMMKDTVGVQNGAMAVYNAFADRVPVLIFSAAKMDGAQRNYWFHAAQDNNAIVRDFTKWDDTPGSLQHFAESLTRGFNIASTPPMGPVLLSVDKELQEMPLLDRTELSIPPLTSVHYPVGDFGALRELAQLLVEAEFPVIAADRYARSENAMSLLVELAELLGAAVTDLSLRYNFPTDHPLNQTFSARSSISQTDLLLALEPMDMWGVMNAWYRQPVKNTRRIIKDDARTIILGVDSPTKSVYQNFGRYAGVDQHIRGEAEATMPTLIEEVRKRITRQHRHRFSERRKILEKRYQNRIKHDRKQAAIAWDASPITTARLSMELMYAIKDVDWVLSSYNYSTSLWPQRLWVMNKPYQSSASLGAGGLGDGMARAIGTALVHRKHGRIVVNIQPDGDLMFTPGALWTAAHHRLPILTVVHNNRAYHQEVMELQVIANQRDRGVEGERIGCTLNDPSIDFARLARSMGVWAEGPINAPGDLGPALNRALAIVKGGEPALVDVISEPR